MTRIKKLIVLVMIVAIVTTIIISRINFHHIYKFSKKNEQYDVKINNLCQQCLFSSKLVMNGYLDSYGIDETLMYYYFNLSSDNIDKYKLIQDDILSEIDNVVLSEDNITT